MTTTTRGLAAIAAILTLAASSCCRKPQAINAPCPATIYAVQLSAFDTATAHYNADLGTFDGNSGTFEKVVKHRDIEGGAWSQRSMKYWALTDSVYTIGTQTYNQPILYGIMPDGLRIRYKLNDTSPNTTLSKLEYNAYSNRLFTVSGGNTLAKLVVDDSTFTIVPLYTFSAGIAAIATGNTAGLTYVYTTAGELSAIPPALGGLYTVTTAIGLSWLEYNSDDNMFYGIKHNPANGAYNFIKLDINGNTTDLAALPFDGSTYISGACLDVCNKQYTLSIGQAGIVNEGTLLAYGLTGTQLMNKKVNYLLKGMSVRY